MTNKILITILLLVLTGCTPYVEDLELGKEKSDNIVKEIEKIEKEQEEHVKSNNKYEQKFKETKDGITSWIHEYQSPKGKGYQIFIKTEESLKSIGYGSESESRTWEKIYPIKTSTSTL